VSEQVGSKVTVANALDATSIVPTRAVEILVNHFRTITDSLAWFADRDVAHAYHVSISDQDKSRKKR
jgi:hypothetical protein